MNFEKFPKLTRFSGPVYITEKIDGTNGQIYIDDNAGEMLVGSRTRWITPERDNFGFAKWAYAHAQELINILGPGRHYGEWWGSSIQRGYDLKEKRFSLFNTDRWGHEVAAEIGLYGVPLLWTGAFNTNVFSEILQTLKESGSIAAPGYMNPEGIVIYDSRSGHGFKKTFEYDDTGKRGTKDEHGNVLKEL